MRNEWMNEVSWNERNFGPIESISIIYINEFDTDKWEIHLNCRLWFELKFIFVEIHCETLRVWTKKFFEMCKRTKQKTWTDFWDYKALQESEKDVPFFRWNFYLVGSIAVAHFGYQCLGVLYLNFSIWPKKFRNSHTPQKKKTLEKFFWGVGHECETRM